MRFVNVTIFLAVALLLLLGLVVGGIFLIKYLIRYSAEQNRGKTQKQQELDRMKIEDL